MGLHSKNPCVRAVGAKAGWWTASAASLALAIGAQGAHAQDTATNTTSADETAADDTWIQEIIVTGTLLRGQPPVGSNAITLGPDTLEETAAISSNELLASVPQVTNYFNTVPLADLAIATNQIQVTRTTFSGLMPESNARSSLSEKARMDLPVRVRLRNQNNSATQITATNTVMP